MRKLLQELFARYQRDVYLYLFSLCRDAALAEELTADTFLEVVKSFCRFRGESDEKTWLFSIARHRWYTYLRQKKKQPVIELIDELLESGERSPEEQICERAAAQRVGALLDLEPERTRKIVALRLEGLSFHEIGQHCGISENSARVIDFRARARLRAKLKEEGYTDE